jgi:hypothetical protein
MAMPRRAACVKTENAGIPSEQERTEQITTALKSVAEQTGRTMAQAAQGAPCKSTPSGHHVACAFWTGDRDAGGDEAGQRASRMWSTRLPSVGLAQVPRGQPEEPSEEIHRILCKWMLVTLFLSWLNWNEKLVGYARQKAM